MESNFSFLEKEYPVLSKLGSLAEAYLYSDPNSCLVKMGMFSENLVKIMMTLNGLILPPNLDNTNANNIRILKRNGFLPREIDDILYAVRRARNDAAHDNCDDSAKCETLLRMMHKLAIWFMQSYGETAFKVAEYVQPQKIPCAAELQKLLADKEAEIARLTEQTASIPAQKMSARERVKRAAKATINLTESETRVIIDAQLRKAGWDADTDNIRYSKGARPQKGKNLAIAEWPTDSEVGIGGWADYAFFAGSKFVAITEAKRKFADIPSVIDNQCKEYARCVKKEHAEYQAGEWGPYKVPFVFATNGRKYLKQLDTKSGVWFLDLRDSANIPRALQGWMSPDGLIEMLEKDTEAANKRLGERPDDQLADSGGLALRPYQLNAVRAAETAIRDGKKSVLLSMATGTGKTRTVMGMIYRFLSTGRFSRILFIVDRNTLGEQAQDFFKDVKVDDLLTLNQIYNIKELGDKGFDKETKIQVATIQSLIQRVMYGSDDEPALSVSDYDLIIVDEAHRGYILDKEMSDEEQLYRSQDDYVSKYRTVIDYFDAVKIALTATPALHTTEIFGPPVFTYSYREAVVDGYLVDHDAAYNIITKFNTEGIDYNKGETMVLYDPVTGEVTNSAELEDDVNFDVDTFNRQVITESFNSITLKEISNHLDPEGEGKTLIYAVDDQHADLIVKLLKEIYAPLGVDNDAIMKITGSIYNGSQKKINEMVRRFKNERYPNIVVTVDLLTTGIDVAQITSLVFMRRVKSRILFEQMLGRATRLCPEIGKTHFDIFDAVRIYESLAPVTTMKPVSVDTDETFEDMLDGLVVFDDDAQINNMVERILARMQRRKRRLTGELADEFIRAASGNTADQFIKDVRSMNPRDARAKLLGSKNIFGVLDKVPRDTRTVIISDKQDELRVQTRGYGNGQEPGDYIDSFKEFINNNMNEIAALSIICTRPKDLTRAELKSLRLELDSHRFTEQQLNSAWKDDRNEDIAADIISFIRRLAIGSALVSHEKRIKGAVEKLRRNHNFTKMQLRWLDRIEAALINETVIDREVFDSGAFKDYGGYAKMNITFDNNIDEIILELNKYLYEDGGKSA